MQNLYNREAQLLAAAGLQNVTIVGATDIVITFDAINDTQQNRELYAQKLGGSVTPEGAIEIVLQNGKLFVYLNDEDWETGTVYASFNA
jgi:hypothetical protein